LLALPVVAMAESNDPTIVKVAVDHKEMAEKDLKKIARAVEIRSRALAMALAEENPRPFRKSFLRLYLCLAVAYMCSSTNGFDANTFGGLSAEPDFAKYFGLTPKKQRRRRGALCRWSIYGLSLRRPSGR